MVVNIHFAGLALWGLAGHAVEDTALPLAAGRLPGQKLEGVLARRLHAEGCLHTGVIVVLVEDQPRGGGGAGDIITASSRGSEPGGQVLLNLGLDLLHPLAAGGRVEAAALRAGLGVAAHALAKLPFLGLGRGEEDADVGASALRHKDLGGGRLKDSLVSSQHSLSLSITVFLSGRSRGDKTERLGLVCWGRRRAPRCSAAKPEVVLLC